MNEKKVVVVGIAVALVAWSAWVIWNRTSSPLVPWPTWAADIPALSRFAVGIDFTDYAPRPSFLGWPLEPPKTTRNFDDLTKIIMEGRLRPI